MKRFLITDTVVEGDAYKRVFEWKDTLEPIPLMPSDHDLCTDLRIPRFTKDVPPETVDRILFFLVRDYLLERNFDLAYELLCTRKSLTQYVFYWIFGTSRMLALEKLRCLRKVFALSQTLYDEFLQHEATFESPFYPLIVMSTEHHVEVGQLVCPWNLSLDLEIVTARIAVPSMQMVQMGPYGKDGLILTDPHEKEGVVFASDCINPFLFCCVMDYLGMVNIWRCDRTYLFQRWFMLLQFCFGPRFGWFFFERGAPFLEGGEPDVDDPLLENWFAVEYHFKRLHAVGRK